MRLRIDKGCESSANHTEHLKVNSKEADYYYSSLSLSDKPEYDHDDRWHRLPLYCYVQALAFFFDGMRRKSMELLLMYLLFIWRGT